MLGEVVSVDEATGDGVILGQDQQTYAFVASACRGRLRAGQPVEFAGRRNGVAEEIFKTTNLRHYGVAPPKAEEGPRPPDTPIDWANLFWSPQGRLRRSHYWAGLVLMTIASALLGLLPVVGAFTGVLFIWPSIVLQTKRLHDMGRTGWLQLAPYGVMLVVGFVIAAVMGGQFGLGAGGAATIGGAIMGLIGLGYAIWVGATDSQPSRNQFGESPKATPDRTAEAFA